MNKNQITLSAKTLISLALIQLLILSSTAVIGFQLGSKNISATPNGVQTQGLPIAKGGTNAVTEQSARDNLSLYSQAQIDQMFSNNPSVAHKYTIDISNNTASVVTKYVSIPISKEQPESVQIGINSGSVKTSFIAYSYTSSRVHFGNILNLNKSDLLFYFDTATKTLILRINVNANAGSRAVTISTAYQTDPSVYTVSSTSSFSDSLFKDLTYTYSTNPAPDYSNATNPTASTGLTTVQRDGYLELKFPIVINGTNRSITVYSGTSDSGSTFYVGNRDSSQSGDYASTGLIPVKFGDTFKVSGTSGAIITFYPVRY
ncbi:MAG: hypothetical protein LBN03_01415 [Bifidobacteriaceae bacterium]|jgi:hypothetical protein|nr:hypothetical protein [Bifidobacteriaceae bacterium]